MPPYEIGQRLELQPWPGTYGPGVNDELSRLFQEGLTQHGAQYMTNTPVDPQPWTNWATEAFFEAVRRAEFEPRLSRMQAVFGFETEADAATFIGAYRSGSPCAIYRVRGEIDHKANMSLLQLAGLSGITAFQLAHDYWRGEPGLRPVCWELLLRPPVEFVELVEPVVQ